MYSKLLESLDATTLRNILDARGVNVRGTRKDYIRYLKHSQINLNNDYEFMLYLIAKHNLEINYNTLAGMLGRGYDRNTVALVAVSLAAG